MGGSALQWRVQLDDDVVDGSPFELVFTLGKVGGPDVTIRWQILIADPSQQEFGGEPKVDEC